MNFLQRWRYGRLERRLYRGSLNWREFGMRKMYDWWLKNTEEGRKVKDAENATAKIFIRQWEEKE